jgi:hypothetical protein
VLIFGNFIISVRAGQPEEMTVHDYDFSQWKKAATQSLTGLVIIGIMHYKWEFVPPLFFQVITANYSLKPKILVVCHGTYESL